jgi:hypothetical protein
VWTGFQDKKGSASFLSNTNRFMLRILSNPASTYSFEAEKRVRGPQSEYHGAV